MRTLIVHEWLTNNAGADRVVGALRSLLDAPVATTMRSDDPAFADWEVHTSALQRFARGSQSHVPALPLMPAAWQAMKLPPADLVITSFHTFAHWARIPVDAEHLIYCHTPPRYLWPIDPSGHRLLTERALGPARLLGRPTDRRRSLRRPARWVTNSTFTARRLEEAYGLQSIVIEPPVDYAPFEAAATATPKSDYYLTFGRVVPQKGVALAVDAFRGLDAKLVVAGAGRQLNKLRASAPPNVEFTGYVPEHEKPALLASARALIVPGTEDFGIVPHEALAAGTPVIAFRSGGLYESMPHDWATWFDAPNVHAIRDAISRCPDTVASTVDHRFSLARFHSRVSDILALHRAAGVKDAEVLEPTKAQLG